MTKIELVMKELDDLRQFYLQINYRNKKNVTPSATKGTETLGRGNNASNPPQPYPGTINDG